MKILDIAKISMLMGLASVILAILSGAFAIAQIAFVIFALSAVSYIFFSLLAQNKYNYILKTSILASSIFMVIFTLNSLNLIKVSGVILISMASIPIAFLFVKLKQFWDTNFQQEIVRRISAITTVSGILLATILYYGVFWAPSLYRSFYDLEQIRVYFLVDKMIQLTSFLSLFLFVLGIILLIIIKLTTFTKRIKKL